MPRRLQGKNETAFEPKSTGYNDLKELALANFGEIMTQLSIDQRVAALEVQVANLVKSQPAPAEQVSDWRSTFGMFTGDAIIKEGRRIRQEDRDDCDLRDHN